MTKTTLIDFETKYNEPCSDITCGDPEWEWDEGNLAFNFECSHCGNIYTLTPMNAELDIEKMDVDIEPEDEDWD